MMLKTKQSKHWNVKTNQIDKTNSNIIFYDDRTMLCFYNLILVGF